MEINFFFEDVDELGFDESRISKWIQNSISFEGKESGDINFIFCSDEYLLDMNQRYLQHDFYTDVITFDYVEGKLISGDIFISVDRLIDNAKSFGVTLAQESDRIMIHGVLHLLGYKDKEPDAKRLMTEKENFYLAKL